jgi:hypothetical protein
MLADDRVSNRSQGAAFTSPLISRGFFARLNLVGKSGANRELLAGVVSCDNRAVASTEISRLSAIAPELAGLFSEALSLRRHP